MVLGFLNRFVDSNDRELRRIQPLIDEANALEPEFEALSDAEIRARFDTLREEIRVIPSPTNRARTSSTTPSANAAAT
jgi:preprotein translocase subunit SecA